MKEKPGLNHKNQFGLMVIVSQVDVYRWNERERDWRRGADIREGGEEEWGRKDGE
jgi:hypothetical protein